MSSIQLNFYANLKVMKNIFSNFAVLFLVSWPLVVLSNPMIPLNGTPTTTRTRPTPSTVKSQFNEWPQSAHFDSLNRDFTLNLDFLM